MEAPAEPIILVAEPGIVAPQRIRFAEEIFGAPAASGKKAKGKRGRDTEEPAASAAKPKRAKRTRDNYTVEDDEEVDEYADLVPKR
jgi:hypothetical protein